MTIHEYDLDGPVAAAPASGTGPAPARPEAGRSTGGSAGGSTGWRPGRALTLTVLALAGTAIGAVAAAAPSGRPRPAPITSTISARDVSLEGTRPAIQLQIVVVNPRPTPATITELVLDDQQGTLHFPVTATIGAASTGSVPLTIHPDCTATPAGSRTSGLDTTGWLRSADGAALPLVVGDDLDRRGGLCALLDQDLPRGWRSPVTATSVHAEGDDLVLQVPGLADHSLVGAERTGAPVPQEFQVYIADRVLSATLTGLAQLRLLAPAPCLDGSVGDSVPMSLRVLTRDDGELQSLLVQVGPLLAQWVSVNC